MIRTLINFPDRFNAIEQWERGHRDHPKRKNYALLRDQSNGNVSPMTLQELREQYQSQPQMNWLDSVACVQCGVGDFIGDSGAG